MKRSKSVVLTSVIAGASISVTACDVAPDNGTPVQAQSYASVAECKASGTIPAATCDQAYLEAAKADTQNAQRFDDRQTCEEQYGVAQCVPRNNGSFFTPLLTGFIVGQMLNGGGGYRGAPMYRDRGGNYYGGAGQQISRNYVNGRTTIGSNAFDSSARAPTRVQSRSSVISRGGFGGGGGRSYGG